MDQMLHKGRDVLTAAVLVLEIIGMLPDVKD